MTFRGTLSPSPCVSVSWKAAQEGRGGPSQSALFLVSEPLSKAWVGGDRPCDFSLGS